MNIEDENPERDSGNLLLNLCQNRQSLLERSDGSLDEGSEEEDKEQES